MTNAEWRLSGSGHEGRVKGAYPSRFFDSLSFQYQAYTMIPGELAQNG